MKKDILFILVAAVVIAKYSVVAQTQAPYYPSSPTLSEVNAGVTVNEYTGALNVSVPIYNVVSGDVTVPLSLNYNATGNKESRQDALAGRGLSSCEKGCCFLKFSDKLTQLLP